MPENDSLRDAVTALAEECERAAVNWLLIDPSVFDAYDIIAQKLRIALKENPS